LPTIFPPHFPSSLALKTRVVLADTVRQFPDRSKLESFCRELVSRLSEVLCGGVRAGVLEAHAVPDQLTDLLHYVLVANCERDNHRFEVQRAVINSDEWHALLRRMLECEENLAFTTPKNGTSTKDSDTPRERVEAFMNKMQEHGNPITKSDIWRVAGYHDATEFERFQRGDDRTTAGSRSKFDRILGLDAQDFMKRLEKLGSK
jgi:hypothetical protein